MLVLVVLVAHIERFICLPNAGFFFFFSFLGPQFILNFGVCRRAMDLYLITNFGKLCSRDEYNFIGHRWQSWIKQLLKFIFEQLKHFQVLLLAALTSSRSLVVCWFIGMSVDICEKVTFRVLNGNCNLPETYLFTFLPTYVTVVKVGREVTIVN